MRPFCLAELYTAIMHNVPIVCVCLRGTGYDFEDAKNVLKFLGIQEIVASVISPGSNCRSETERQLERDCKI